MRYLSGENVLILHSQIIDETGGSHGVRDVGLFMSILEKPKMQFGGKEFYPGVFLKAAVYLEGFAKYHVFIDGNKRIGFASSARFLYENNYVLVVPNSQVVKFMLKVVVKNLDIYTIASWLRKHSRLVTKKFKRYHKVGKIN